MHKLDILDNWDLLKALTQMKGENLEWLEMKERLDILWAREGGDCVNVNNLHNPSF
jgi:hypothetical protein